MFKSYAVALLLATVSAIQIEKPVGTQKKTKDINCRIGEGANSVGQTVCDIVKDAVDVKPWPRTGPAPEHTPQYYKGNEGDVHANRDGTLKAAPEEPKAEPTDPKKDAAKAEAAANEPAEKDAKKEEAKEAAAEEKKEAKEEAKEAKPAEEEKKEEAPKEEAKKEEAPKEEAPKAEEKK